MNIVNLKNITKLVITILVALIVTHEVLSQDLELENLAFEKPVWTDDAQLQCIAFSPKNAIEDIKKNYFK